MRWRRRRPTYATFTPGTMIGSISFAPGTTGVTYNTTSSQRLKMAVPWWRRRLARMLRSAAKRIETS